MPEVGFSHRQVAKKTGISKRSVTRIAQEPATEGLDEEVFAVPRCPGAVPRGAPVPCRAGSRLLILERKDAESRSLRSRGARSASSEGLGARPGLGRGTGVDNASGSMRRTNFRTPIGLPGGSR